MGTHVAIEIAIDSDPDFDTTQSILDRPLTDVPTCVLWVEEGAVVRGRSSREAPHPLTTLRFARAAPTIRA